MPLNLAETGITYKIVKVGGLDKNRKHLSDLGFEPGETIEVISSRPGGCVVKVKGSSLAIGMEIAKKIIIADISR